MVQKFFKTLAVSALIATGFAAHAQSVTNGSFELPTLDDGVTSSLGASGWTTFNNIGDVRIEDLPTTQLEAQNGENVLSLRTSTSFASQTITGFDSAAWGYQVSYWVFGTGTVSLTGALAPFSTPNFTGSQTFNFGEWTRQTFDFRTAGSSVTLQFAGSGTNTPWSYIDNVTVSAIPEPESYAMLLAGLGAIGFMSRRRRNNQA